MRGPDSDFEFERRFLVEQMPEYLLQGTSPDLIVQTYFLASEGYGLRIRLQATGFGSLIDPVTDAKQVIQQYQDQFDLCMLAAKGPYIGGTRYEAERELDVGVGAQMSMLGGQTLVKLRYGVWLNQDGWVIDRFLGDNRPLIIAECERTSPVINLEIPRFCVEEVTADANFSNDSLVGSPFGDWGGDYSARRALGSSQFDSGFGTNRSSVD